MKCLLPISLVLTVTCRWRSPRLPSPHRGPRWIGPNFPLRGPGTHRSRHSMRGTPRRRRCSRSKRPRTHPTWWSSCWTISVLVAPAPFGGVIHTPHFDKLAKNGLRYNQFHTTALCSPTRQALKTGRNHHSCNQAKITEVATSFPGATGMLPNDVASIGEILRLNGYSTAAFGKWHETAVWEISPSGPFTRWPNFTGLRRVLRIPGRRDESVGARRLPQPEPRRDARRPRLSLHE